MTNKEKFKETFGFNPNRVITHVCIAPSKLCKSRRELCDSMTDGLCPFNDWWNKEYKPCFKISEEFDE